MPDITQTALFDTAPVNGHPARLGDDTEAEERPGYQFVKRIGWIPEDWESPKLGALGRIRSGATPARSQHERYFESGETPWVKTLDLTNGPIVSTDESITDAALAETSCKVLPEGTILVAMYGGLKQIGRTGILKVEAATNQALSAIEVDRRRALPDYVLRWLNFRVIYWRMFAASSRKDPNITGQDVSDFPVALPPLPEQREIARVLGAWDRALADLDALIEAKRQRARGLAQRLLTGRARLPGFEERIPMRPLGDFFRHVSTRNKDRRDLTPLSCSKIYGIVPQSQIFDKRIASDDTSNYKVVQRGDLVYDPMLLWDASIGFVDSIDEGVISPAYATFHLNEKTGDRAFFRHFFDGHYMRHQYKVISQGTNTRRRKAMASDFLAVDARVPLLDEQRQIAAVLDAAGAEIAAQEAECAALAAQKQGLMQRLLTGEVRVAASADVVQAPEPIS